MTSLNKKGTQWTFVCLPQNIEVIEAKVEDFSSFLYFDGEDFIDNKIEEISNKIEKQSYYIVTAFVTEWLSDEEKLIPIGKLMQKKALEDLPWLKRER